MITVRYCVNIMMECVLVVTTCDGVCRPAAPLPAPEPPAGGAGLQPARGGGRGAAAERADAAAAHQRPDGGAHDGQRLRDGPGQRERGRRQQPAVRAGGQRGQKITHFSLHRENEVMWFARFV